MNTELLIAKGKLADLEKSYKEYEMKADSYFIQIRELLSPYNEFLDLELDKIFLLVREFRELQLLARDCKMQIDKLKETYNL
ncbi:MAG TPA: hypothetical protein PK595_06870 [Bacteroidota bacterium]|nr:hypothetical protein [Bacteroidota bacterium]